MYQGLGLALRSRSQPIIKCQSVCFVQICSPLGPIVICWQAIPNLSKALSPKCERYANANNTRTLTSGVDLIEKACAARETVFSTTFSV